jgi:hypothetical protein
MEEFLELIGKILALKFVQLASTAVNEDNSFVF